MAGLVEALEEINNSPDLSPEDRFELIQLAHEKFGDLTTSGILEAQQAKQQIPQEPLGPPTNLLEAALPRSRKAGAEEAGFFERGVAGVLDVASGMGRTLKTGVKAQSEAQAQEKLEEMVAFGRLGEEVLAPYGISPDSIAQETGLPVEAVRDKINTVLEDLAETEGEGFFESMLISPATPILGAFTGTGIAAKIMQAVGGGIKGLITAGAVEGSLGGAITQAENVLKGEKVSPGQFGFDVATNALIPGGIVLSAQGMKKIVNPILQQSAEVISGVSKDALKAFGTGFGPTAKKMKEFAGKGFEIGKDLLDKVNDLVLPESEVINKSLDAMPTISTKNLLQKLKDVQIEVLKGKDSFGLEAIIGPIGPEAPVNKVLNDLIKKMSTKTSKLFGPKGKPITTGGQPISISAKDYFELRKRLDAVIDWGRPEANALNDALKEVRLQAKTDLLSAAKGQPQYEQAMKSLTGTLDARDDLYRFLGSDPSVQLGRVETFINNLYGKNKKSRQLVLGRIEKILGEDFTKRAKLTSLAKQFGEEGIPKIFNQIGTGKSTLAFGLGASAGSAINPSLGVPGAIVGGVLGGPKVQAGLVGLGVGAEKGAQSLSDIVQNQSAARVGLGLTGQTLGDLFGGNQ